MTHSHDTDCRRSQRAARATCFYVPADRLIPQRLRSAATLRRILAHQVQCCLSHHWSYEPVRHKALLALYRREISDLCETLLAGEARHNHQK